MVDTTASQDRYLIFDESGNLGNSGRYFVIACIDTSSVKSLHNIMHKKLGIAKKLFPELSAIHSNEIKAKDAYPCIKHHILECIAKKDLTISYIVADLSHIEERLLRDKNILYNYLMKLLIERLVTENDNGKTIHIICDNHTTKVASKNSFSEYIKLYLLYDKGYDVELDIQLLDSDANNAYIVQAADYVANSLYGHYEYANLLYSSLLTGKYKVQMLFPWQHFGK